MRLLTDVRPYQCAWLTLSFVFLIHPKQGRPQASEGKAYMRGSAQLPWKEL